ncbi:hypothetical protein BDP81DRAFT_415601 [Colletotrichum phormii]|uniref:Secreted protein n=1 Tax=Colletotrichum phormii TaxID=359342 RepID=A0AAJ0EMF1_9PEZI|nr:uncharacterized protein BDP81DRAFT_415601 [Colletotrichum phormii]KAK1654393.1 hypothetical protein BDP81DRAFT_415601 [Colletotrichum phormii]
MGSTQKSRAGTYHGFLLLLLLLGLQKDYWQQVAIKKNDDGWRRQTFHLTHRSECVLIFCAHLGNWPFVFVYMCCVLKYPGIVTRPANGSPVDRGKGPSHVCNGTARTA